MAATFGLVGGPIHPMPGGLLTRLKQWLGIGRRFSSYTASDFPENEHHARFTPAELDECIERSLQGWVRDDEADCPPTLAPAEAPVGRRKSRRAAAADAAPKPAEARAFGGDLYPTAAHCSGQNVRYVRVKTWVASAGEGHLPPPKA